MESKPTMINGLIEGEFKVYDRQLRLWGFEAQQK
jgi:molybdopterin/thiamine biosynthesis adenylyltransferase